MMMELLNIASSPDPLHQVDLVYRRPLSYTKMESLVKEMQDEETGVPVRSQKIFLSSIPAAFAGYDIIEWLMERLTIEDSVEAIHLANLLCQHGYFFPVGTNSNSNTNFSVKDDSSLYRFQTPYFWPNRTSLTSTTDTSVDYAIYLFKRTLRNKQKHALDDYEQESYNDLRRCLGNKWDFVSMQADEQVRLSKDLKKNDKLVLDSQERAYWRVVRPPPGVICSIETPPTFNTQTQTKVTRKTNNLLLEDLRNEVELLRNSCIRTRIKASCALESLSSHCESYQEHDPFLSPRQPSNPWHSDDPAYWNLNADVVEVPTERRLKKWAISMEDLVFDSTGLREFTAYLKKEYCHENIRFWVAVREMKYGPISSLRHKAQQIFNEFLSPGSPCEINIDMRTMEAVQKELNFLVPSRFTFDPAAEHVYILLLKKDCYPRFIRSEHYKALLHQSQQISLKNTAKRLDKFFSFVAERKKKTSATDEHKIKAADIASLQHHENLSSLQDNIPYRGDLDNSIMNLSTQNSLDDVCCPWETSSSVRSDRTTSTDRINRIEPSKQISIKSDKSDIGSIKQKSLEDEMKRSSIAEESKPLLGKRPSSKPLDVIVAAGPSTSSYIPFYATPSTSSASMSITRTPPQIQKETVVFKPQETEQEQPEFRKQLSKQSSDASKKSLEVVKEVTPEDAVASTSTIISNPVTVGFEKQEQAKDVISCTLTNNTDKTTVTTSQTNKSTYNNNHINNATASSSKNIPKSVTHSLSHEEQENKIPEEKTSQAASQKEKETKLKKQLSRKKSTASSTSSAELICPWDNPNGSAPETSTFTKTYSTLGYL